MRDASRWRLVPRVLGRVSFEPRDGQRLVVLLAVTGRFAGVIADPPRDRREGAFLPEDAVGEVGASTRDEQQRQRDVVSGRTTLSAG